MNFAFILRSKAVSSLQSWAYRLLSGNVAPQVPTSSGVLSRSVGPLALRPAAPVIQPGLQVRRPLRVVRVVESGQPRAHVGRMMISGRMADVCAELDRLAAREAAESCGPRGVAALSC
ncbi:MAG: hypothetical protein CFE43_17375 [Burkholderiales bacterium PBB3]|nr:MAG: hypothetical protein CFE43_17375 [Burkholderiales bacterium PBB3]